MCNVGAGVPAGRASPCADIGDGPPGVGRIRDVDGRDEKALALDPDLGPAYTSFAYSYFFEERPKEASQSECSSVFNHRP